MHRIHWWRTSFDEREARGLEAAIADEHITAGPLNDQFEQQLAQSLGVSYCVTTTNGSSAILMSLMALGVSPGDEVIIPNRGWIATAHAVLMLGAKVILVDSLPDVPSMDVSQIRSKMTSKTKAIIPVHLNGRAVDMEALNEIANEYQVHIIEDACQSLYSKNASGFLGTQSKAGCFSLGIGKLISTGQGGFVVTNDPEMSEELKLIRNHGVRDIFTNAWSRMGFNFKFTDILASVGLAQLTRVPERIEHLKKIYELYTQAIKDITYLKMLPVDVTSGEIPLYIEVLCEERARVAEYFQEREIQVRLFNPSIETSPYIASNGRLTASKIFEEKGMFLPCGPAQPIENVNYAIETLRAYGRER